LQKGLTKYTPTAGLKTFQESIAEFYAKEFGANFSPKEIVATDGGKQALFNAACTLVNPGDEVLIPKPYWVTFPEIVKFVGAKSVFIETEETDFILTAEASQTINHRQNKTFNRQFAEQSDGSRYSADEMRKIVEVCAERNVYVLTDECYLFFVYPPSKFSRRRVCRRIAKIRLRRGFVFKNLRDDRLAHRLHDCVRRMVKADIETAKPFDIAPDIFCAIRLRPRDGKSRGFKSGS
jgi:aspartate/methionine/tyrosine aminotransferase